MLNASILPTPAGWQKKPLVDLVDFLDSRRIPIKEQDRAKMAGDIPYYGASGIIDYVNQYIFDEDIILLAEDGANILNRSTPIAFRVSGKCWVNNHAHVFAAKSNADPEYIVQFLEAIRYDAFNSGSAQPKLNREICEQIPVLTPSLPEQRKIAAILRTWDLGLEKLSALRKAKELRFKGLSQRLLALHGRLVVASLAPTGR
jgi:type I restriction enzyme S subunit